MAGLSRGCAEARAAAGFPQLLRAFEYADAQDAATASVPCTCQLVRLVWLDMGAPEDRRPAYGVLGWHYDLCARTIAAMREVPPQ